MTQSSNPDRAAPNDTAFPNEGDTRPTDTDPRRTPDDNRFGYGSDDYPAGEGNDEAVTGDEREMPEAEPS